MLSLPHARGGVSFAEYENDWVLPSSPCTWGCFSRKTTGEFESGVFPMHVGVFLSRVKTQCIAHGLPHARGGVSEYRVRRKDLDVSSPCTWGPVSNERNAKLMLAMDAVDQRYGRGAVHLPSENAESWKPNQERLSPRYTTP